MGKGESLAAILFTGKKKKVKNLFPNRNEFKKLRPRPSNPLREMIAMMMMMLAVAG